LVLGGLVSAAFGVALLATHAGMGGITLGLLFVLFNLVDGSLAVVQASSCAGPGRLYVPPCGERLRRE
jgi:hypothetical protein